MNLLQWGRVLMNAETWARMLACRLGKLLQWGRVLMNAETSRMVYSIRVSKGFNGAAFS